MDKGKERELCPPDLIERELEGPEYILKCHSMHALLHKLSDRYQDAYQHCEIMQSYLERMKTYLLTQRRHGLLPITKERMCKQLAKLQERVGLILKKMKKTESKLYLPLVEFVKANMIGLAEPHGAMISRVKGGKGKPMHEIPEIAHTSEEPEDAIKDEGNLLKHGKSHSEGNGDCPKGTVSKSKHGYRNSSNGNHNRGEIELELHPELKSERERKQQRQRQR
jgi:hypothetical protein